MTFSLSFWDGESLWVVFHNSVSLLSRSKIFARNEGRELNAYRIRKFKLDRFVDFSVSSCFVHIRKPDADIFRLALDIAQAPARQVVYIENTPIFVQVAEVLSISDNGTL